MVKIYFFSDSKDGSFDREVFDFLPILIHHESPKAFLSKVLAVETKAEDENIANLLYFVERLKIPFLYQVVLKSGIDYFKNGVRIISADKFLTGLI